MMQINALITSVGGIVGQGIIKSLKHHNLCSKSKKYYYNLFGTDIIFDSAGLFRVDKFSIIGKPTDEAYIDSIISICCKNNIHLVFVGSDEELHKISSYRKQIEAESSAKVIVNPLSVVETCRDKFRTFEFLKDNNLNFIPSCLDANYETFVKEYGFPLIIKPREGFGSKLLFIVNNDDELKFAIASIKKKQMEAFASKIPTK
jgi:carbamoyl-phosphate synthase large subunit